MTSEEQVLTQGLDDLREIIGATWQITPVNRAVAQGERVPPSGPPGEQVVYIQPTSGGGSTAQVLVTARPELTPQQARHQFRAQVALMHNLVGSSAVLVITPWLSPRTREALDDLGYNYLDLTGNVSLRINMPAIIIRTEGARQNPSRSGKQDVQQLRGATAGRLVRVLVDAAPPYRAIELAEASGVSLSYVSRLLDALEDEALITRDGRLVVDVDWPQLIRVRASQFALLKANPYVGMLAQPGLSGVLQGLRDKRVAIRNIGPVAVTGTFAAREIVPAVAVGGQLMIYVPADPRQVSALDSIADAIGLLRTDTGADVLLLRATNPVVFERTRNVKDVPHVALSQLAIDSFSGTGRMPAEGEALLGYMTMHVSEWRAPNLSKLGRPGA